MGSDRCDCGSEWCADCVTRTEQVGRVNLASGTGTDVTVVMLTEGYHSVRRIVSDRDLTMEQIGEYLAVDCDYIAAIEKTPEPEEYKEPVVEIVAYICEDLWGNFYLSCTKDGVWSDHRKVLGISAIGGYMRLLSDTQMSGTLDHKFLGAPAAHVTGYPDPAIKYGNRELGS